MAPHTSSKFYPDFNFLRQHLIFAPPGTHLLIKWTKTLQHHKPHYLIQLPSIKNYFLCPVRAFQALLGSRPLLPTAPLFANNFHPYAQVIDTHIRDALKRVLAHRNLSTTGHSFHTFRRSGATLPLTITLNSRTLWPLAYRGALPSGFILKMPRRLHPLYPPPFQKSPLPPSNLALGFLKYYLVTFYTLQILFY